MITKAKAINSIVMHDGGGGGVRHTYTPRVTTRTTPTVQTTTEDTVRDQTIDANVQVTIEPIFVENKYSRHSQYLLRTLNVFLFNAAGQGLEFKRCKMSISGSKFIGIQQDMFTIKMQNINLNAFAQAINMGHKFIKVVLEDVTVFAGTIKVVNTGRENIVERSIELKCLMKVTELLSDMVSPITVNSSANIWAILGEVTGEDPYVGNLPEELKDLTFDEEYTFQGYKKTVIDDIIRIANDKLSRSNNKNMPWLEYTFDQDGIVNLFGPYTITEVLNMQPYTGLLDTPKISEDSVEFNSIFKKKLIPGRVVKLDNALFKTLGNQSAFVYGWDPNGLYVITEVRIQLSNYPNSYKCSCKARPLSKYNNFVSSLGG